MADEPKVEESIPIELFITRGQFMEMAEVDPIAAAQHLDGEILAFDAWMQGRGLDPLTKYEMQILREYLGFKLTVSGG